MTKDINKEWEEIWKKFTESLGFLYDNENVITSLKRQKKMPSHKEGKDTLDIHMHEMEHLIEHHIKELISLTQKASKLAKSKGKDIEKECKALAKAIQSLDMSEIKSEIKNLKNLLT